MIKFLNDNASAIQAVAAVISVLVTCVLAYITFEYVKLTRTLALAAQEGLDQQKEVAKRKTHHLLSLLKMIRIFLAEFSNEHISYTILKNATNLEANDIAYLQQLSSEFGVQAGQYAAVASSSLRWMKDKIDEAKVAIPHSGYNWAHFPIKRWKEELQRATENIELLWSIVLSSYEK